MNKCGLNKSNPYIKKPNPFKINKCGLDKSSPCKKPEKELRPSKIA